MSFSRAALTALLLASVGLASAQVIWNESVNGDLSGDRFNPNNFNLGLGNNEIIGSMGGADKEYVHFHLSSGMQLSQVRLVSYVSNDDFAFIGVQAGNTLTEDPSNANAANLLGYTLYGSSQVGTDILPAIGMGSGSIGFTGPLTGSDYTFWIQQTGDPTDYRFNFVVTPEPTSLAALGLFSALIVRRRTRRK